MFAGKRRQCATGKWLCFLQIPGQHAGKSKRPGVPQYQQIHIILRAGLNELNNMLPTFEERLLAAGGKPVNWLTDNRGVISLAEITIVQ